MPSPSRVAVTPYADSEGPWTTSGSHKALRDADPATFPNTVPQQPLLFPLLPLGADSDPGISGAHRGRVVSTQRGGGRRVSQVPLRTRS